MRGMEERWEMPSEVVVTMGRRWRIWTVEGEVERRRKILRGGTRPWKTRREQRGEEGRGRSAGELDASAESGTRG